MKATRQLAAALAILAVFAVAQAQNYTIDWSTVDGGGGTSTGSVYSISGTIGQPDAGGTLNGGQYSLTGGFWSFVAVQTPGAPLLTIKGTSTNTVLVVWPSPSAGYTLQQNTAANTTNWQSVLTTPFDNGTTKTVIISPASGLKFFRLAK